MASFGSCEVGARLLRSSCEVDMNERKRMIIKALKVSRKYKLTGLDKLCIFLFKEWKYRKEYQCVNADADR